jgi:acyl dehydratase
MARIDAVRTVSSGQIAQFGVALKQGDDVVVEGLSPMFVRRPSKRKGGKKERKPDETVWTDVTTFAIAPDQPARYALASQDYNPIHTKPLVAKMAGFPRPIAHGLCVMAVTTARLVEAFGGSDPARLASVKVRFATPAFPEQELTLQVAGEGQTRQFQLLNPKGRPVLSNGEISFR